MKKQILFITLLLSTLLLISVTPVFASANVTVVLDGETVAFDVPPQIVNDRTLVPLRAIFEAMGASINWNADTQTVTATKADTVVVLIIGNTSPTINGNVVTIDQPGIIVEGRTLAPLRFVAEAFGGSVDWNDNTQTAAIFMGGLTAAPVTPTPSTDGNLEEKLVRVEVVTEESLNRYDSYHEFIEFEEEGYQKIIFLAAAPLKEFKFIEVTHEHNGLSVVGETLYSLDELQPAEPLVVTWMQWGLLPHRGITFIDENNKTRCFFINLSGENGSVILIEYPVVNHQGAPAAYKPILDALFLLEERTSWEEYDSGEELEAAGFVEYPYPHDSALGYALADLNKDGVLELLLGSIEGLNNSAPNSIFTLSDGEPVLLTSFWSRSRGVISADGTIYSVGSGGAAYTYLSSYKLDKNSGTLIQLTDIHSDYSPSEEKTHFVKIVDGKNHYISEQDFFDFTEIYDNPPNKMKLTFIPIVL